MNRYTEEKNELKTYGFDEHTLERLNRLVSLNNYHKHIEAKNELVKMGKRILPVMNTLIKSELTVLRREAIKIIMLIANRSSIPMAIRMLIKIGRVSIRPLLKALIDDSHSYYLRKGAHHVLSELIRDYDAKEFKELLHMLDGELLEIIPVKTLWILNNIQIK
jgi:hypothetical protein